MGSQTELLRLVQAHWGGREPGTNRTDLEAVVVVPMPCSQFRCDTIKVTPNTELHACFARRQPQEDGFALITGVGPTETARYAAAVLYSKHTLLENGGQRSTQADWEVVALLTSHKASQGTPLMDPLTIARNVLEKPGGTKMPTNGKLARALIESILRRHKRVRLFDPNEVSQTDSHPAPSPQPAEPSPAELEKLWANTKYPPPHRFWCDTVRLSESTPLVARYFEGSIRVTARGPREPARWVRLHRDPSGRVRAETSPIDGPPPPKPERIALEFSRYAELRNAHAVQLAESVYHHSLRAPAHGASGTVASTPV